MQPNATYHNYPSDRLVGNCQPSDSERRRNRHFPPKDKWEAYDVLTGAFRHICEAFSGEFDRPSAYVNVMSRCLIMRAQDAVVADHDIAVGDLIQSLVATVERAEGKF